MNAARVTVVVLCVCVCVSVCLSTHIILAVRAIKCRNERYHRVKHQICCNIKIAFFLIFSYSKVRVSFTYLSRGRPSLVDVIPRAMFRTLSVTYLLTHKALCLII